VAALLAAGADLEARDGVGSSPAIRDHGIFRTLNEARFD